jgi:hypothetical protein
VLLGRGRLRNPSALKVRRLPDRRRGALLVRVSKPTVPSRRGPRLHQADDADLSSRVRRAPPAALGSRAVAPAAIPPAVWARAVNAEASVRRSGCRSGCAVEHLGEFLAGALRLSREVALDRAPRKLWLARTRSRTSMEARKATRSRPRQAGESDGRPPDREARPRRDPQAARPGTVREDPCACGASQRVRGPLRAILASELMGFGAVLEQGGRGGLIALRRAVREPTLVWPMLCEIASCA